MKKAYGKPLVSVEVMSLDQPIALNCNADKDDLLRLMEFGYFMEDKNCTMNLLPDGGVDWNGDGVADDNWGHDTVCYHSNVQQAFLS